MGALNALSDFVRPLVISGPSGVGKSTLLHRLFAEFPDKFAFSISHTTRSPRPGEIDGKHYHFTSVDTFKSFISNGAFIEYAEFSGNYYGTSFRAVRDIIQTGRRCILDIESQGVRQIKRTDLNPVYLFISPPSMTILRERLIGRATDSDSAVQKRLATALKEVAYAKEGAHDTIIINDDLDRAYNLFKQIALGDIIIGDDMPALDD